MSATYWTCPVTFSGPSGRGIERPTPFTSRVVFIVVAMASAPGGGHGSARLCDRGQHLGVAGASAQVAGDAVSDLLLGGVGGLGEDGGGGHEDTGNAESALGHAVADEGVLQRMKGAGPAQPLHGLDGAAPGLHGQHEAA